MVKRVSLRNEDVAGAFRRLALRARLTAVSASVAIVLFFVVLIGSLLSTLDLWVLGFLALVSLMGILYVGANPWMAATDFLRAAQVVAQIPSLAVIKARGFMFPRAVLRWSGEGGSASDLILRFTGGVADEFGGSSAQFRLEVSWTTPSDIMASKALTYADFPELVESIEEVRRALSPGEYLWSNTPKRRLESVVVPDWGHVFRPNQSPESVVERLLSRRTGMNAIRFAAMGRMTFAPKLIRYGVRGFPGPFSLSTWCPRCRHERWVWSAQSESICRRCQGPTVQVLSRLGEGLRKKIERLDAAGFSVGA